MAAKLLGLCASVMVWTFPFVACAQVIAPVSVELTPAKRITAVTVTNRSGSPMTFQAQMLAWSQKDGADAYQETADPLVVPPVASVPPGGSQIFRVATRQAPPEHELSYRLILEDVTGDTGTPGTDGATVRLQFRHSIPVFVEPASATGRPQLQIEPCATAAPRGCVRVRNVGQRRAKVLKIGASAGSWRGQQTTSTTILAGSWRQWVLDDAPASAVLSVSVDTTSGNLAAQLPSSIR